MNNIDNKFIEWLAGLIDGNGCFTFTGNDYCTFQITMPISDLDILVHIQQHLGGTVSPIKGVKACRIRIHNKNDLLRLVNLINGNIRNSKRIVQFQKLCNILNVTYIPPFNLTKGSNWFTGYFDSDGCITANLSKSSPTMTISVSAKHSIDLTPLLIFNGKIYYDKSSTGTYLWSIQNKPDILNMLEYFKECPSRTSKSNRILLIQSYYNLKALNAHKAQSGTPLYNEWLSFISNWPKRL